MNNDKNKENQTDESKESNTNVESDVNWNKLSGKIRNSFPNVTDKDLQFMANGESELIGRLQMKTGRTKSQIRDWVRNSSKIM